MHVWLPIFFVNDTTTTDIYTLSLHDALPIRSGGVQHALAEPADHEPGDRGGQDRKSTRLNSSHQIISYAVFCLKKKNEKPALHLIVQRIHDHAALHQSAQEHSAYARSGDACG